MKSKIAMLFLIALSFLLVSQAQTPAPDPLSQALINAGIDSSIAPSLATTIEGTAANAKLGVAAVKVIQNQLQVDEQKEANDVAGLNAGISSAFAAALAKDATSLQSCPTGQACSFTIPACDLSGVFKADPNNGPTQPSADPTFGCKAGWLQPGEKLYYTQYVPLAGLYTLSVSAASVATTSCPDSGQTGRFHLEIAGKPVFPVDGSSVSVPRTASWSSYQTLALGQVQLSGGVTKFAFVNDSTVPSCFDLLWLGFAK
jgi:hypothetical protein